MVKFFIDTGKLTKNKNKLKNKILNYKIIIFDLDNTIFPLYFYDLKVFHALTNKLGEKLNISKRKIFQFLIKYKYKKNENFRLFNKLINIFKLDNVLKENELVNFYQNYKPNDKVKFPTIISLLKEFQIEKKLILITEGHYIRQKNKINYLRIKKYFKHVIILDNRYNREFKPSTKGLKNVINYIKNSKTLYIGDSNKDKLTAKKLKIDFYLFDISKCFYTKK